MASESEIETFLRDFKYKLDFWGLLLRHDRGKNYETLLELEYSTGDVKRELRSLAVRDYSEGPLPDLLHKGTDMWVFGKAIESKEVYIKITVGQPSDKVLCISFHFSEKSLSYPYKNNDV